MRALISALVVLGVASPVFAQPAPWAPERMTAGWVFTPSLVFGGLWDSNVTVSNEGVPQTSEYVGLVNPRGEIDFNGKRAKMNAGYSGTLEAYQTLDELTRYDQRGRLEARYQMTPRLQFLTRHQLTLVPTTDQLELGGLPFTRVGSRQLDSRGGFTLGLSTRTSMVADYYFQWVDFEREAELVPDFASLQGGHAMSPSLEVEHELTSRVKIGGLYSYRHSIIDAGEEVIDTHQLDGTIEVVLGPSTTVGGSGGMATLRMSNTDEEQRGPSYSARIAHRLRLTTLEAGFERNYIPSFGFGGMSANQVAYVRAHVPFAQGRAYVSGSTMLRRTEPLMTVEDGITLDSYWTTAAVGYSVVRWLRMEGFYALAHQVSSAQGNVDRTRVGVQFVTTKPVRIH
jgi:hypothetical protein